MSRADRADARRQHLLNTARTLFVERGFHQTGVAQIAAASGVKVGQIYRDFASKEDIIAAISEAKVAAFLDEDKLAEAVSRRDFAAIREWIGRFNSFDADSEDRLFAEVIAEAGRNERVAAIFRGTDARVRECLATALSSLAPAPERAAARERLIDLILTLGFGFRMRRLVDPDAGAAELRRYLNQVIDREIDGLAG